MYGKTKCNTLIRKIYFIQFLYFTIGSALRGYSNLDRTSLDVSWDLFQETVIHFRTGLFAYLSPIFKEHTQFCTVTLVLFLLKVPSWFPPGSYNSIYNH